MSRLELPAGTSAESEPAMPRVTVAVCTYDRYEALDSCLAALAVQLLANTEFECIVVDNSPSRARSDVEARRHAAHRNLRWMHEPTPGLSNARNVAVREARAPLIAYVDDDAIPEPDWLSRMLEAFDTLGEEYVGIGGKILPVFPVARPEWLSDKLLGYVSVVDLGAETRGLQPKEWVAGANIAYRVSALRQVGGFSPALGRVGSGISLMSNDETELAERLAAKGGRMGYAGRAVVRHMVDETRLHQDWFRRRIAWQAVSDYVRHPQKMYGQRGVAWKRVKTFLAHQPPDLRTQRALALEQASSAELEAQLSTIYNAVNCLLSGACETDE